MKKFILFVYGAIALISTLWFISALYRIIFVIKRVSDDYWWLLIPIIFSYVALFTVLKKPSLIDKYKKAWSFFTIPYLLLL